MRSPSHDHSISGVEGREGEGVNFISLGAGVQSSTMALMASRGEITPMPDYAIFADTQAEPVSVYRWLDWLEKQLPFPVLRVTKGNLGIDSIQLRTSKKGNFYTKPTIPAFTINKAGKKGKFRKRQCTVDYKLEVINREVRKIIGRKRSAKCSMWIGISIDEVGRMKPSRKKYIENRFPLIEMKLSRAGCLAWMKAKGYPQPPRSACVFCPYHNDKEWQRLKTQEPEEFQRAVEYENGLTKTMSQVSGFRDIPFLHRSCLPLSQVNFENKTDQNKTDQLEFNNECEGMCGV